MLDTLMRLSGGTLRTRKQAEIVLYIVSAVFFIISIAMLAKTFIPPAPDPHVEFSDSKLQNP